MKIVSFLLLAGLLVGSTFSTAPAESGEEKSAITAAQVWLSHIDKGRYGQSWKEASTYFQGAISEKGWAAALDGVRKPLGAVVSRKVTMSRHFTELPGAPDGQYVVMEFQTSFEKKKSAVETVTFTLEKDGKWKAAGYFIK